MTAVLSSYAERARGWLVDQALPFWSSQGVDHQHGGFCESAGFDGVGHYASDKRILVQGRQIYTFSHAHAMGLVDDLTAADQAIAFIDNLAQNQDDAGWLHMIRANGEPVKDSKESYDHAFMLLALGWYQHQKKDALSQKLLQDTLSYVDSYFVTERGYREAVPDRLPRRQNPHMHLFEAMLALFALTGEQQYLNRADAIYELFETVFFDAKARVVREFFTEDWQPDPEAYDRIEPGHLMEWVWLLRQYQRINPQAQVNGYCHELFQQAMALGYDNRNKVLIDCVAPDGRVIASTRRCWPQTEGIKAALVQYGQTGDRLYSDIAESLLSSVLNQYLSNCPAGGWNDMFDADMKSVSTTMPASTLYHIFVCFEQLMAWHFPHQSD